LPDDLGDHDLADGAAETFVQPETEMKGVSQSPGRIEAVRIRKRFGVEHRRPRDGKDGCALGNPGFVLATAAQGGVLLADAEEIRKWRVEPQCFEHEAVNCGRIVLRGGCPGSGEVVGTLQEQGKALTAA